MRKLVLLAAAAASFAIAAAPASAYNDFTCRPTAAHSTPVVLVHGTFANSAGSWNLVDPALRADAYCTFALDYGNNATGPIEQSAQQLADFVDRVLAATGASKVSIVGHSQGGMMPRYYVKNLGGDAKVDDLVGLAPSNHGTDNPFAARASGCPACVEQAAGSPFITQLNAGDESPGSVSYTQVSTRYDEVVTPYTSAFLAPDANVTNVTLQDVCPNDTSEHLRTPYDPRAIRITLNALGPPGPSGPGLPARLRHAVAATACAATAASAAQAK